MYPVDGVSFWLDRGETLALVGESGCGKSLSSLALLQLVPNPGQIEPGSVIRLADTDALALRGEALRRIRGRRIGMIFQDPMTSLNPVFRVGDQIVEGILAHFKISRAEARDRALQLLQEVGIPDPVERLNAYPHQLSGGMRQRVMIAIALAAEPEILVADEPTTALDVTVQAQILEVLDRLRTSRGMAVLLITHDLGIWLVGPTGWLSCMPARSSRRHPPTTLCQSFPPLHPGTLCLGDPDYRASPPADAIRGNVPAPSAWPSGCRFRPPLPQGFR